MDSNTTGGHSYSEFVARRRSEWLGKASRQIELTGESLDAIDRRIGLADGDILVCETTCLAYAIHALECGAMGLLLVPPQLGGEDPSEGMLDAFWTALVESSGESIDALRSRADAFIGFTNSTPDGPFKLLITTQHVTDDQPATEWPLYNKHWVDMLNTEGAAGAVIYTPSDRQDAAALFLSEDPYIMDIPFVAPFPQSHGVEDLYQTEGFVSATELPGGHVMLAHGKPDGTFLLEDLSDPANPWTYEATAITLMVNCGCITPSMTRSGVKVLKDETLGDLATRISRGTTLSEKNLEVIGKLRARAREAALEAERAVWATFDLNVPFPSGAFAQADRIASDPKVSARAGDLYYVDGSSFEDGEVWPSLLGTIPKGQERYIVDSHDGEVLLVSRNSKQHAIYRPQCPTLISNSVFVIRLGSGINSDYLACWMRGLYARAWMHNGGKMLSKATLASLPVPILSDEVMEQTVRYARSIDERILALQQKLASLKGVSRYAPLSATSGPQAGKGPDA